MTKNSTKKRRSRKSYKVTLVLLFVLIICLTAFDVYLLSFVKEKESIYNEYIKQMNAASSEKNFDEETKKLYSSISEKKSLINDLKSMLNERTVRREELKSEAIKQYNITAEIEAKKRQLAAECGYSTYEDLLEAYYNLITEN